ncbi:hypothetical protein [Streptosporangium amethystogenes]|nr:hypothetical protein [Streptosporangium amethystogenes]
MNDLMARRLVGESTPTRWSFARPRQEIVSTRVPCLLLAGL